jgi:hypothetical protein
MYRSAKAKGKSKKAKGKLKLRLSWRLPACAVGFLQQYLPDSCKKKTKVKKGRGASPYFCLLLPFAFYLLP